MRSPNLCVARGEGRRDHMKSITRILVAAIVVSMTMGSSIAWAQEEPASGGASQILAPKKDPPFGEYGRWIKHQEQLLGSMETLWGASSTIPEGYGIVFFGWQHRRAWKRFDKDRKIDDVVPVITAPDPFEKKGKFFTFDFGVSGRLQGYGAGFQYGVTDTLTVGINTFWAVIHIDIDPIFTPGSSDQIGVVTREDFYKVLVEMGRPIPVTEYDSSPADLGDTTIDVKWNPWRGKYVSTGVTGGIITPTAHRADPNQAIIFGLGPDLDVGATTWGGKLGGIFDVRLPDPVKWVTFSFSAEGAAFLETIRETPEFPKQNQDVKDYLASQGVDVNIFPDLSDIESTYGYTPGPWFAAQAGIGMGPLSIAYRHGFAGAANYRTDSEGLKTLIDEIGLVGYGDDGKIIVNMIAPLTPLFIPGLLNFNFEYATDGRNALIFRDVYTVGIGLGFPLAVPDRYKMGPKS